MSIGHEIDGSVSSLITSTEFLFGQSVESLLPQTGFDPAEFIKAFDRSLLGLAIRVTAGPFKPLLAYDPGWKKGLYESPCFYRQARGNRS